jgi:hypothetical protein
MPLPSRHPFPPFWRAIRRLFERLFRCVAESGNFSNAKPYIKEPGAILLAGLNQYKPKHGAEGGFPVPYFAIDLSPASDVPRSACSTDMLARLV